MSSKSGAKSAKTGQSQRAGATNGFRTVVRLTNIFIVEYRSLVKIGSRLAWRGGAQMRKPSENLPFLARVQPAKGIPMIREFSKVY